MNYVQWTMGYGLKTMDYFFWFPTIVFHRIHRCVALLYICYFIHQLMLVYIKFADRSITLLLLLSINNVYR